LEHPQNGAGYCVLYALKVSQKAWCKSWKAKEATTTSKAANSIDVTSDAGRAKLKPSNFVIPENRSFPIVEPQSVQDAVSSWGRANPPAKVTFEVFKRRLIRIAHRKGPEYVAKLPESWGIATATATKEQHTGVMVAFMLPADAAKELALSIPGAEPPEELHLTLCYLGDKTELPYTKRDVIAALEAFAEDNGPIEGTVAGFGRFNSDEGNNTEPLYAAFDAPGLPEFRQELVDYLALAGIDHSMTHGYTPHITLAYIPKEAKTPDITVPKLELNFSEIVLAWGSEQIAIPLTGEATTKEVAEPGKLGGKGYYDQSGKWQYGEKPTLQQPKAQQVMSAMPRANRVDPKEVGRKAEEQARLEQMQSIMTDTLGADATNALAQLADSPDAKLDKRVEDDLVRRGLIDRDKSGYVKISSGGKAVIRAAQKGDDEGATRAAHAAEVLAARKLVKQSEADQKRQEAEHARIWAKINRLTKKKEFTTTEKEFEGETLKHLPGKHNQMDHARRHLGGHIREAMSKGASLAHARSSVAEKFLRDPKSTPAERLSAKRILKRDHGTNKIRQIEDDERRKLIYQRDSNFKGQPGAVRLRDSLASPKTLELRSQLDAAKKNRDMEEAQRLRHELDDAEHADLMKLEKTPLSRLRNMADSKNKPDKAEKQPKLGTPVKTDLGWINKPIPTFNKDGSPTEYDIKRQGVLATWEHKPGDRGMGMGLVIQGKDGEFYAFDNGGVKVITPRKPKPAAEANLSPVQREKYGIGNKPIAQTSKPSKASAKDTKRTQELETHVGNLQKALDRAEKTLETGRYENGNRVLPYENARIINTRKALRIALEKARKELGDLHQTTVAKEFAPTTTITVYKEASTGKYRWLTVTSTAYRDRDRQIVSTKALQQAVAKMDARGNYGPARWWHVPGLDIGDCDVSMIRGRTLIESGTFRDNRIGQAFKAATDRGEKL
jgi:2'-5' RNA ligase